MKCSRCGNIFPGGLGKCPNCGNILKWSTESERLIREKGFIKELFSFDGRYTRKKFLVVQVGTIFLPFLLIPIGEVFNLFGANMSFVLLLGLIIFGFVDLIINITSQAKRLQDLDFNGWLFILSFVPIINFLYWIYLFFKKGTSGDNNYGSNPLQKETFVEVN